MPALNRLFGYNLKRVYMLVRADFRDQIGDNSLSTRTFSALCLVVNNPGITQSELARRLGIERSGLVAMVDELQRLGYVERKQVPTDRRVQALQPTRSGKQAAEIAFANVARGEENVLSALTAEEQSQLRHLLEKIRASRESDE